MAGWPHHISAVASRALERWRYLAAEGLSWSRSRQKGKGQDAVEAFTAAYRRSATELARVKAFSPDRQLADYIETAVANAHFAVYKQRRPKFRDVLRGAVFGFPALVRQYWAYHLVSILITFGCAAIAFIAVMNNPETFYLFIDRDLAGGRDPSASTEFLASGLGGRESSMDEDTGFSGMLFTHNTRVAFMCFAWGIVLGLPTIYLLIKNGLMLGSFVALYVQRGLGVELGAWLLPHGVPEIGAIILCGGAGLALGHRVLNPGRVARSKKLRKTAEDACLMALGCVPLLAIAAVVEGVFRQSYASTEVRYALFAALLIGLGSWIAFAGRRKIAKQ
jgi:uncharacterized membrane protein SpoIIM required for sporulation